MSAAPSAYRSSVAPLTPTQIPLSQRSHWYACVIGTELVQLPLVAVRVSPSRAVPVAAGRTMFTGGAARTGRVILDVTVCVPAAFRVVTATLSVESMSAVATR